MFPFLLWCPFPQLKSHSYSSTPSKSHSLLTYSYSHSPQINPFTFLTLENSSSSSSSPFKPYLIFHFVLLLPAGLMCTRACFLMGHVWLCLMWTFIYDFSTFFTIPIYGFIYSEGVREGGSNQNSPNFTRWSSLAPSHPPNAINEPRLWNFFPTVELGVWICVAS